MKRNVSKHVNITPEFRNLEGGSWFAYALGKTPLHTKPDTNSNFPFVSTRHARFPVLAKSKDGAWLKIFNERYDRAYFVKRKDFKVVQEKSRTQSKRSRLRLNRPKTKLETYDEELDGPR